MAPERGDRCPLRTLPTVCPGGEMARRPEAGRGGGCRHIESRETGEGWGMPAYGKRRDRGGGFLPPPRLPHPRGDVPTVQRMGENLEKRPARGGGCQHIESGETGERRMPPRLPNPHRSISPTVQGMGRTWRKGRRGMGDASILCVIVGVPPHASRSSKIR